MPNLIALVLPPLLAPAILAAEQASLDQILERLNRLEQENRSLRAEVEDLRREVSALKGASVYPAAEATIEERLSVTERRVDEQAQAKVEAAQKFPVRLSGMLLANLYHNGPLTGTNDHPTVVARAPNRQAGGITFRQSIIGLELRGPQSVLGAHMRGSIFVDFFDGLTEATNFYPIRVRTASIELDWKSRTLMVGQEKPLFSMRDPNTFSYSGVSPLTASGNLWRWQPQIRFEQRAGAGSTRARGQIALVQTWEEAGLDFAGNRLTFERRRPGLQGRFELSHHWSDDRRIEVGPGFHFSQSHVSGFNYNSHLAAVDWLIKPTSFFEFSGLFWSGQNVHHFGALRQSFGRDPSAPGGFRPVEARGGWAQISLPVHQRVSLNLFGGVHDDRNNRLGPQGVAANRTGAVNIMYRLAPNVIVSLEAMRLRTTFLDIGNRNNNRYDLSLAYLF